MKIISGAQTGVDRAGLDAALELGINFPGDWMGWCPKGRRSESGVIPAIYTLTETESASYKVRTEMNVSLADVTLIIKSGVTTPGTGYTIKMVQKHAKPCRVINLLDGYDASNTAAWLADFKVLNIAGPRESTNPGIGARAKAALLEILGICLEQETNRPD